MKSAKTVVTYREVPNGAAFRVLKEGSFPPRPGVFVKVGNSHAVKNGQDAIFALSDVVRIIRTGGAPYGKKAET